MRRKTFLIATLRQSIEKIAFAERSSRMQALRGALTGIKISGEHEPAHCVLDKACQIYESNALKYLEPAACVSRSHEIQGTTKNRELTFEKGSLVLKSGDDKLCSPTDSEIKVHYAMVRRALSFQFARLMSYAASGNHSSLMLCTEMHPQAITGLLWRKCCNVTRQLGAVCLQQPWS